ncbi:MAG: AbrB/MazE/SpoVT family DNA-binding domain-containing protein [Burkholderiales bacterium]
MPVATITSKGQITVPQAVREQLGLHSGDKVDFVLDETGGFKMIPLRKEVTVLRGRFAGRATRAVSVQDMNEAVEAEAAARQGRNSVPVRRRTK